jgi:SAM-dependent methyltransferase
MDNKRAEQMKRFWDEGARKHPYFCVASGAEYLGEQIDFDRYFASGEASVAAMFRVAGWNPRSAARVLEIGCGTGRVTRALARRFAFVDAVDVSEEMVSIAKRDLASLANVRFHVTNGVDLSAFPDQSFEYACSELVFRHIPSKDIIRTYLSETARVLTRGGQFAYQFNGKRRLDARRLLSGSRYALRAAVACVGRRLGRLSRPMDPGYSLQSAWRGTSISASEVGSFALLSGLVVDKVMGRGTDQMWVVGHKAVSTRRSSRVPPTDDVVRRPDCRALTRR